MLLTSQYAFLLGSLKLKRASTSKRSRVKERSQPSSKTEDSAIIQWKGLRADLQYYDNIIMMYVVQLSSGSRADVTNPPSLFCDCLALAFSIDFVIRFPIQFCSVLILAVLLALHVRLLQSTRMHYGRFLERQKAENEESIYCTYRNLRQQS